MMFAARALVGFLNFGSLALVARLLGPAQQGEVTVAFAFALILIQIGTLGFVTANPAFVAKEPSLRDRLVINAYWMALAFALAIAVSVIALRTLSVPLIPDLSMTHLLLVLFVLPLALLTVMLRSILLGLHRTIAYNLTELAMSGVIMLAIACALLANVLSPTLALVALLGQYAVGALVYAALMRESLRGGVRFDLRLCRTMLNPAIRIYVATVIGFLLVRLDLLLVAAFLGDREAGLYSAATMIAQAIYLLPTAVGLSLLTRVAHEGRTGRSAAVFRSMAILLSLACALVAAIAGPFVALVFGSSYEATPELLRLLLPGTLFLGLISIIAYHFAADRFPLKAAAYTGVGLIVNVAMNVAMLPVYGVEIASVSSSVAYLLVLLLQLPLFARDVGGLRRLVPGPSDVRQLLHAAGRMGREPASISR